MATNLWVRIRSIQLDSIREFEKVKLTFQDGINVVQIRNGYGKTTLLNMLRWMFTGNIPSERAVWPIYKRDYGGGKEFSSVCMELDIKDHTGEVREWTLWMKFDHKEGKAWFETESAEIGGHKKEWKLPTSFAYKFRDRKNFTELFLFDGETAKELSKRQDHVQIESALREITGLRSVFQHMEEDGFIDALRTSKFKENAVSSPNRSLNLWTGWRTELADHLADVANKRTTLNSTIGQDRISIDNLNTDLDGLGDDHAASIDLKGIRKNIRETRKKLADETRELLLSLGNPSNLPTAWDEAKSFHNLLFESRIPEGVGRPFFEDILDDENCICGTPWEDHMKKAVKDMSSKYLGDDILTTIKSMQKDVREATQDDVPIGDRKGNITSLKLKLAELSNQEGEVASRFDEETQTKRKELKGQVRQLSRKVRDDEDTLQKITETDPTIISNRGWDGDAIKDNDEVKIQPAQWRTCENIHTLNRVRKALDDRLAMSGPLMALNTAADVSKSICQQALEDVMKQLRAQAEDRANEMLDLIPGTGGGINVRLAQTGITFVDDDERIQSGANMGAVLSAAYCFISAMAELGNVNVPLVADSPITGMDNMTSEGWTNEIWPMFSQSVFFVTPGERLMIEGGPEGSGSENLYGDNIRRVTVKREGEDLTGRGQTGKMTVSDDEDLFRSYAAKKRAEE